MEEKKSIFTPEQEDAISAGGRFIIVSAAAGSGKTTVLIEKLIRLLSDEENGIRADKLIIVTFTNDAAAQIIRKLGKALDNAIAACSAGTPEEAAANADKKRWLLKQQTYLGAAKISTISSFCFNLIRSRARELDISTDFRIIDDNENKLMLIDALEETADSMFESDDKERNAAVEEIYSYFGYYTNNRPDKSEKYGELLDFRSFLLSIPYYEDRFIKPLTEDYKKGFSDDFDPFDTHFGGIYADNALAVLNDADFIEDFKYILSNWSVMINDTDFPGKLKATAKKHFTSSAAGIRALENYYRETLIKGEAIVSDARKSATESVEKRFNQRFHRSPADKKSGCEGWDRLYEVMSGFQGDIFRTDLKISTRRSSVKAVFEAAGIADAETTEKFLAAAENMGRKMSRISDIHPCTAAELKEDYRRHFRRLMLINDFIGEINSRCGEMKREKNVLSFEDGEQLALRLLGKTDENGNIVKTEAAENLSKEFGFIMIDEFQDSNDMQDIIFRLLSPCGTSSSEGQNMFVVGDIKQSIYNFRLANPLLFRNYLNGSEPYADNREGSSPANILLNRNFRSSKNVIDFVNLIFGKLMSEGCGGINYDDTQKLIYSGEVWEKLNSEKAEAIGCLDTEIMLIDKKNVPFTREKPPEEKKKTKKSADTDTEAPTEESDAEDASAAILEAKAAAMKIRRLLDTHPSISCRDICILVPTNADAPYFEAELRRQGIRASLDNRSAYLESREISTALNMLRILDDPHGNVAMAGCLMSPLFGFAADDMALLTILRGKLSLYDMLIRLEAPDGELLNCLAENGECGIDEMIRLSEKVQGFLRVYRSLREYAASMNIEDTIRMIYERTGLIYIMSLYPDGDVRRANLNLLPEYARAYEQGVTCGTGGIYGFIRYIDSMTPNKLDFAGGSAASESDDAVAVKTIHKSKGLEYPIVFLCRTHKTMRNDYGKLFYTLTDGAAFIEQDETARTAYYSLPAEIIARSKKIDLISEKMRLMYVALTRAKHKLYISGVIGLSEKGAKDIYRENAVYAAGKYADCECEITACPPDPALKKELFEGKYSDMFTDEGVPSPDSLINAGGRMLYWIIAALYASKGIPCFSADGTVSERIGGIRIMAEHIPADDKITPCEMTRTEETEGKPNEDISCFEASLEMFRNYEYDEKYQSDICRQSVPAKLTVTEITKRAYESEIHFDEQSEETLSANRITGEKIISISELNIPKVSEKLTAAEKGTAIHAFMQYADFHELEKQLAAGAEDPVGDEAARLNLEGLLDERAAELIENNVRMKKRIAGFLDSSLWKDLMKNAKNENILREQPFMAKISDIFDKNVTETLDEKLRTYYNDNYNDTFIQGIADCIVKTEDGFVLIDYKTNEGKTAEELAEMYSVQLLLYTRVFELIFGLPKGSGKAYIYSLGIDGGCTVIIK